MYDDGFCAFAAALSGALRCRPGGGVGKICFLDRFFDNLRFGGGSGCFCGLHALSAEAAPEETALAAQELGEILADPAHGPRSIRDCDCQNGIGATPVFVHLCRALTAESRLRSLRLTGSDDEVFESALSDDGMTELAAALAPGRSRLERLTIGDAFFSDGPGCVHPVLAGVARLPSSSAETWAASFRSQAS